MDHSHNKDHRHHRRTHDRHNHHNDRVHQHNDHRKNHNVHNNNNDHNSDATHERDGTGDGDGGTGFSTALDMELRTPTLGLVGAATDETHPRKLIMEQRWGAGGRVGGVIGGDGGDGGGEECTRTVRGTNPGTVRGTVRGVGSGRDFHQDEGGTGWDKEKEDRGREGERGNKSSVRKLTSCVGGFGFGCGLAGDTEGGERRDFLPFRFKCSRG